MYGVELSTALISCHRIYLGPCKPSLFLFICSLLNLFVYQGNDANVFDVLSFVYVCSCNCVDLLMCVYIYINGALDWAFWKQSQRWYFVFT